MSKVTVERLTNMFTVRTSAQIRLPKATGSQIMYQTDKASHKLLKKLRLFLCGAPGVQVVYYEFA